MNNIAWRNISHFVNTAICYDQNQVKSLQLYNLFHLRFFRFLFLSTAIKMPMLHYALDTNTISDPAGFLKFVTTQLNLHILHSMN